MSYIRQIIESEIEKLSEKDRKLLKDKIKRKKESFENKISKLVDEEFDKLQEGRPMPMDTPNEFAYSTFKKWAYKNRTNIKNKLKKALGNGSDGTKMYLALTLCWKDWASKKANEWSGIPVTPVGKKDFGRELAVMMIQDDLILDKKAWKKDNLITHIKEGTNKSDVKYAMKLAFDNIPGNWHKALKKVDVVGDKIKLNMSSYMGPGKTLDAIVDEFNNAMGLKGYMTGPKPFKVDKSSYQKGSITSVMLVQEGKLNEDKAMKAIIKAPKDTQ